METMLVRLKEHDPRRGHVLRRYTYEGIKFQVERGWYRVSEKMAKYLEGVRQVHDDPNSPLAFDVCTEQEAQELDATEEQASKVKRDAADAIEVSVGRDEEAALIAGDLPEGGKVKVPAKGGKKG